jgi:hypothetical protein
MRFIPFQVNTECPALNEAWAKYMPRIVTEDGVFIKDTDEAMNWHAFLGHSVDMQGFRAAEFSGTDRPSFDTTFVSLRDRGLGVKQLGELWGISAISGHLRKYP